MKYFCDYCKVYLAEILHSSLQLTSVPRFQWSKVTNCSQHAQLQLDVTHLQSECADYKNGLLLSNQDKRPTSARLPRTHNTTYAFPKGFNNLSYIFGFAVMENA